MNSTSALILGHGLGAFLQSVRSLGRRSIQVDVNRGAGLALRSRYIREAIDFPDYREESPDDWLRFTGDLLREKKYDFVLPCSDDVVLPFIRHREFFQSLDPDLMRRVAVLSGTAYEISSDKYRSAVLAAESGLPVPEFHERPVDDALIDFVRDHSFGYPLIIKPRCSYVFGTFGGRRVVRRIRSEEQLRDFVSKYSSWERCMVQKNFNGTGIGVYLLAKNGRILACMAQERLHEPLEGGGGYYRRSILLPTELLPGIEQAVRSMHYTGVAMFEFKRDSEGRWAFIEINGRFWGSLALSIAAGCDFPFWLYQMQCENREDFPRQYRIGIYSRNLYGDLHWIMDNRRADHSDPSLSTRPLATVLAESRHWLTGHEYWDSFAWRDPGPFFGEVGEMAGEFTGKLRRKYFPRCKGKTLKKETMLRRFPDVRNLLVICYGNICRSPFAAAWLRKKLAGIVEVREGGYLPQQDRPTPEIAQNVTASLGVDLSEHRSRRFTDDDLDWADMVLCFDENNYDHLRQRFAGNVTKIWPLGTLLAQKSPWIEDPYGSNADNYRRTYEAIRECCDLLVAVRKPSKRE